MSTPSLLQRFFPELRQLRTSEDSMAPQLRRRLDARRFVHESVVGRLSSPSLVSSYAGAIEEILLSIPQGALNEPDSVAGYRSVIERLRPGTKFVVVHHADSAEFSSSSVISSWFKAAGRDPADLLMIPMPARIRFTDWAEDAYVSVMDRDSRAQFLIEPWSFRRQGDALIADVVDEATSLTALQAPLVFQGGNCLIGDVFWLLGADYFAATVAGLQDGVLPIDTTGVQDADLRQLAIDLYGEYLDADRELVVLGTHKPLPTQAYQGVREGARFFLDMPHQGAGLYQPVFHIDMFVTLVGPQASGRFRILVGSPALADAILRENGAYTMSYAYDEIAEQLSDRGFDVVRIPLVLRSTTSATTTTVEQLRRDAETLVTPQEKVDLSEAIIELLQLGAQPTTPIHVREWHHISWNNCLVENAPDRKRVYMPTFGHGANADLAALDSAVERIWTNELGFEVVRLGDFNSFARRQGVVHCIKKYLRRGS